MVAVQIVDILDHCKGRVHHALIGLHVGDGVGEIRVVHGAQVDLHAQLFRRVQNCLGNVGAAVGRGVTEALCLDVLAVDQSASCIVMGAVLDHHVFHTQVPHTLQLQVPSVLAVLGRGIATPCGGKLEESATHQGKLGLTAIHHDLADLGCLVCGKGKLYAVPCHRGIKEQIGHRGACHLGLIDREGDLLAPCGNGEIGKTYRLGVQRQCAEIGIALTQSHFDGVRSRVALYEVHKGHIGELGILLTVQGSLVVSGNVGVAQLIFPLNEFIARLCHRLLTTVNGHALCTDRGGSVGVDLQISCLDRVVAGDQITVKIRAGGVEIALPQVVPGLAVDGIPHVQTLHLVSVGGEQHLRDVLHAAQINLHHLAVLAGDGVLLGDHRCLCGERFLLGGGLTLHDDLGDGDCLLCIRRDHQQNGFCFHFHRGGKITLRKAVKHSQIVGKVIAVIGGKDLDLSCRYVLHCQADLLYVGNKAQIHRQQNIILLHLHGVGLAVPVGKGQIQLVLAVIFYVCAKGDEGVRLAVGQRGEGIVPLCFTAVTVGVNGAQRQMVCDFHFFASLGSLVG